MKKLYISLLLSIFSGYILADDKAPTIPKLTIRTDSTSKLLPATPSPRATQIPGPPTSPRTRSQFIAKETKTDADGRIKFPEWSATETTCQKTCKKGCVEKNTDLKFCSTKEKSRLTGQHEFSCTCMNTQEEQAARQKEHEKAAEVIKLKAECLKACTGTGASLTVRFNKKVIENANTCIPECYHGGQTNATKAIINTTKVALTHDALQIAQDLKLRK